MNSIKNSLSLILVLLCFGASAQVPMRFNYQAVARNAAGSAIASQNVGVRIVLTNGPGGTTEYMEHHAVTTNPFGVFSIQVGSGIVDQGSMNSVSWSGGNVWIKVEMDATGGTNYTTMGFAQLLSVPYAMVSGTSLNGGGGGAQTLNDLTDVTSTAPSNGQVLSYNGTQWIPTTINLTNTDNQTLTIAGNTLSISGGNSVTIPTGTTYTAGTGIQIVGNTITNIGDISNMNEIQTLSLAGNSLSISNGNSITLPLGTDAQTLTIAGNTLSISNGNSITIPGGGTTYTAGTGISLAGNVITNTGDADNSTSNELQSLTVAGNTLSISNGNSVTLPTGTTYTAGSGINIAANTISATDNSITNEIQTLSLAGNTLSLSNGGGNVVLPAGGGSQALDDLTDVNTGGVMTGHVLKFDGTNWTPAPDNSTGGGSNLWNNNGNHIYNFNSGNVGIGTTNPTSLFHVNNSNAANNSNVVSVENSGDGYNFYSYKTGTAEAVYLVKDNLGSGTPNIYATNNGSGNTMDVFSTGTGYAGNFRGGPSSPGALYAKSTSTGYAGVFDGDFAGSGINAKTNGSGHAGVFDGKVKVNLDGSGGTSPQLTLYEITAGEYARLNFQNASGTSYWTVGGATHSTLSSAKLSFTHSSAGEVMTITGEGNIGMMNNAPTARLHLIGGSTYANSIVKIENTNGTSVTPTVSITSGSSGELISASKTGIGYGINIQKTGSLSSSATIYGSNAGSNGEGVRGSVFGAGGYGLYGNAAGSGTASFTGVYGYGSGSSAIDYGIYGQQGAGSNDYAGYFSGNVGYTGTLLSTSDARLKQNIKDFNGGLNAVMQLKAKTYEYKHSSDLVKMNLPEGEQIGLIAQDIEKVLPELIKETQFNSLEKKDGETQTDGTSISYKGVNYIGMIPVLINAIQEQQAQIEELKKQIEELKK